MYVAFLGIGWVAARRNRENSAADFIVAGRTMPLWLATLTMTATWVDGGYLLGTTEGTYHSSLASGLQGGVCFGISLILGGLVFAKKMREHEFTTLIDPFEARFGARWAVVLSLPAMLAEMFWSAELLVALGATFGVVLGLNLTTAILISAAVVTIYTMAGGMWAVAYTDAFQLALVAVGLAVALPVALGAVGGFGSGLVVLSGLSPRAVGRGVERVVVGCQRDARAGRHSVELLLPARALVPQPRRGAGALGAGGPADDRAHDSAAALRPGRVRVSRGLPSWPHA